MSSAAQVSGLRKYGAVLLFTVGALTLLRGTVDSRTGATKDLHTSKRRRDLSDRDHFHFAVGVPSPPPSIDLAGPGTPRIPGQEDSASPGSPTEQLSAGEHLVDSSSVSPSPPPSYSSPQGSTETGSEGSGSSPQSDSPPTDGSTVDKGEARRLRKQKRLENALEIMGWKNANISDPATLANICEVVHHHPIQGMLVTCKVEVTPSGEKIYHVKSPSSSQATIDRYMSPESTKFPGDHLGMKGQAHRIGFVPQRVKDPVDPFQGAFTRARPREAASMDQISFHAPTPMVGMGGGIMVREEPDNPEDWLRSERQVRDAVNAAIRKRRREGKRHEISGRGGAFHALDDGAATDDESSCKGMCGQHGFCSAGECRCAVAWEGPWCSEARQFPAPLSAAYSGGVTFSHHQILHAANQTISYKTNAKKSGGHHSLHFHITQDLVDATPGQDPLHGRIYPTCAIVGNSGLLNKYLFGPEIDSHDMVVRFNKAPTKGWEPFAGSKTSIRLVNTLHAFRHEGDEIRIQQMQSKQGVKLYVKGRRDSPEESAQLLAFAPEFSAYVSSNVATLPTGGFFGVFLALHLCGRVTLYGFHFRKGFGVPHHYFDKEKPRRNPATAIHDYDAEYVQIQALARAGLVRLAEPCVAGCTNETAIPSDLPPGAACACNENPLPVALPGFCRAAGSHVCFLECSGGAQQCPGGLNIPIDKNAAKIGWPADGDGDCPREVELPHVLQDRTEEVGPAAVHMGKVNTTGDVMEVNITLHSPRHFEYEGCAYHLRNATRWMQQKSSS